MEATPSRKKAAAIKHTSPTPAQCYNAFLRGGLLASSYGQKGTLRQTDPRFTIEVHRILSKTECHQKRRLKENLSRPLTSVLRVTGHGERLKCEAPKRMESCCCRTGSKCPMADGPDLTESRPTSSHGTHVGGARPVCRALETTLAQPSGRGNSSKAEGVHK